MSPENEKVKFEDKCPLYSWGVDNTLQIQRTNTFIIRMWYLSINQMRLLFLSLKTMHHEYFLPISEGGGGEGGGHE